MDPTLAALNSQGLFGMGEPGLGWTRAGLIAEGLLGTDVAISGFISTSRPFLPISRDVHGEQTTCRKFSQQFKISVPEPRFNFFPLPLPFRGQRVYLIYSFCSASLWGLDLCFSWFFFI